MNNQAIQRPGTYSNTLTTSTTHNPERNQLSSPPSTTHTEPSITQSDQAVISSATTQNHFQQADNQGGLLENIFQTAGNFFQGGLDFLSNMGQFFQDAVSFLPNLIGNTAGSATMGVIDFIESVHPNIKQIIDLRKGPMEILNQLQNLGKMSFSNIIQDGKIGEFVQGPVGNCWFLAGVIAGRNDAEFDGIIKNSIQGNMFTGWTVQLPGMASPEKVSFTDYRLYNMQTGKQDTGLKALMSGILPNGAYGDLDLRVIEIAVDKYMRNVEGNTTGIEGDWADQAFDLLYNKSAHRLRSENETEMRTILQNYVNEDEDGLTMWFSAHWKDDTHSDYVKNHAGAITDINFKNNTYTYINPWNSYHKQTGNLDELIEDAAKGNMLLFGRNKEENTNKLTGELNPGTSTVLSD